MHLSFNSVPSRLLDLGDIGIHELDFHRSAAEALASEVEGEYVDRPIAALHCPGNELVRVQRCIRPGQDVTHRPKIAP